MEYGDAKQQLDQLDKWRNPDDLDIPQVERDVQCLLLMKKEFYENQLKFFSSDELQINTKINHQVKDERTEMRREMERAFVKKVEDKLPNLKRYPTLLEFAAAYEFSRIKEFEDVMKYMLANIKKVQDKEMTMSECSHSFLQVHASDRFYKKN